MCERRDKDDIFCSKDYVVNRTTSQISFIFINILVIKFYGFDYYFAL
jgi:hypothetical protein